MTSSNESSARIFASVVRGSETAADELFHRYLTRLSQLARSRLALRMARRVDPEDVVMSAYRSFFVGASEGRFAIERSGDLWALLTTITLRKLYRTAAHHTAGKRDVAHDVEPGEEFDLDHWTSSREPAPEEAVSLADEVEALLKPLSALHRRILELRLQGELIEAFAAETTASERTVRRVLDNVAKDMTSRNGNSPARCPQRRLRAEFSPDVSTATAASFVRDSAMSISFDQIHLKKLIGSGGMGKVYRAVHRETQQSVAVKFLHKSFQSSVKMVRRFLGEAAIIGRLQHPGIVGMHGVGSTAGGVYFLVMDLIEGASLDQCDSIPDTATLSRWMVELADALQTAHAANIVHCDLKPSNVMINPEGRPVITDFGLALTLNQADSQLRSMAGTAPWMAPEQVDHSFGPVTVKTDVYGFGALLYTLLTGLPPFPGQRTPDILSRVISAEAPVSPLVLRNDIPTELAQLCSQCLEKQPGKRPESMVEVAKAMRQIDA